MMPGPSEMGVLMMIGMTLFGGAGLPLGIPPAAEDPLMFKVAPDECLFYMTWAGVDDPDPESSNQTEQLMAEPEVQRLLTEVERMIRTAIHDAAENAGPEVGPRVGVAMDCVKSLLTHPAALFLNDVKTPPGGSPQITAGALVRIGTAEEATKLEKTLVQWQKNLGDAVEEVEILGGTSYRIRPPNPGTQPIAPSITWGVRRGYLMVGVGEGTFEGIMQRAATEMPDWLRKTRGQMPVPRLSTLTHINLAKIIETVAPMAGPEAQSIITSLGLDNVTALSSVTGLDEEGFVSRTLLEIGGEPSGIFTLVPDKPLTADDLGPVPADATVALAAKLDLDEILAAALSVVEKFDPDVKEEFEEGLVPIQQFLELDLRDDLLEPLGDTWRVYNSPGEGGIVITGLTAVVSLRDADRFAATHERLMAVAPRMFANDGPQIRKHEFAGRTIYVFDAGEAEFPLAPSWCLTDDELIVAPMPQNVKAYLSRGADHRSLADVPQVAGLFEEDAAPVALIYSDTKALFELFYPIVPMVAQSISAELRREGIDFDVSLIPSTRSIGRHLRPGVGALRRTPAGIEMISRQTLPGVGLIGAAAPAIVLLGAGSADIPMPISSTTQSMNNMKQIVLALHTYHEVHGKFPPAYATDEDGNPTVSWRVLILPYLEQQALYDSFKIDEPWDSPSNKQWSQISLDIYRTPHLDRKPAGPGLTNYLGVFGDDAIFTGKEGTAIRSIRDGLSRTIMVVEVPDEQAVPWAKPVDYKYDPDKPGAGMFAAGNNQSVAGFGDGHVTRIDQSIDRIVLKAMFTRDGAEEVFAEDF